MEVMLKSLSGTRHLSLLQFGPVRFDVVHDAVVGSRKCDPSDQQDDEDHVGEGRCEVHDLKRTKQYVHLLRVRQEVRVATGFCLPEPHERLTTTAA